MAKKPKIEEPAMAEPEAPTNNPEPATAEAKPKNPIGVGFKKYAQRYGAQGHNGDPIAVALAAFVKVNGAVSMEKLTQVADSNGLSEKLDKDWAKVNVGMKRMNLGNALRGMHNKGLDVVIGDQTIAGKAQAA